jgi:16S rRNA processing protein RimM
VGAVADVQFGAGEAPLLVVRSGKKEFLIPFAAEYLRRLDLPGRRLEMALPEGLLDVDAPLTDEEKRRQRGES